ncbi:MAG: phosphoglycerate dehydrogenase [Actinomycetota bacterium]
MKVLVTEELSEVGLELLRGEFTVDVRPELAKAGLAAAIEPYDALIVRSATKVTADVLAAAPNLKVVARAGIGLDNVDIDAATRRGVLVVNAPQSNIVSAAEHTMALLLSLARHVPRADASLRAGAWERSRYQGVELLGKTLGVVGLGRVGVLVAQRAAAFGMRIVAFDPYVSRDRARELGFDLVATLDELLAQADVLTIHLPKTPETEGIIGREEIARMKDGARIINTARGGLVDEAALADAIVSGHLGGAALDVFADEPATASPLFALEQVVVTPHLGASTAEAQDKAGTSVAGMVRLALLGEFVPNAVNVSGGSEVPEAIRPFVGLADRLGRLLVGLADGAVRSIECRYLGRIAEGDVGVLTLAVLKGVLSRAMSEPVSFVNAPVIARDRGIALSESKSAETTDYVNLVSVRAVTDGGEVSVAGTLGARDTQRIMRVNGYDIEMVPARHMFFLEYDDRPGVIGAVGTIFGRAGINIGTMDVGRSPDGQTALMGLTLDQAVPDDVLDEAAKAVSAGFTRSIVLED